LRNCIVAADGGKSFHARLGENKGKTFRAYGEGIDRNERSYRIPLQSSKGGGSLEKKKEKKKRLSP